MKLIFVLALVYVVGAQRRNMDRSNNMNNTNHMNDTHNMNDTNWSNMGDMDDMDDMDNDTMSGECDSGMSMHFGGGIFNSKKFFKEITNMCIDVRFPRELYKRSKQCLKQEAKKSSLFDNMVKGKFPEKQELAKFMEASCSCQLKAGGINDMNRDLTVEKLLQYMMVDQWGGDEKDKNDLRQQITTCFNQAQGNGYKKLIEYHKCLVKYYLEECEKNDDEPGVILVESSKLLTIGEESKCAPVRLPKDMQQVSDRCLQQAKTNMKKMPESSTTSTSQSGSGSGQDMRSMKLLKHFGMEYMMKAAECFLTELKMFDTQKKIVDINGLTEYVKKFEGWNGIERERDQVIAAMTECAKAYEEDMDSNDDDDDHHHHHMMRNNMNNNNMNNNNNNMMNNTEHKEMKELMKKQSKYDKCFTPKFAEICGVNNEISDFFFPMMNPKFSGQVFKDFMETGGREAEAMMTWLKEKLNE